jgi:hypothetical protein
MFEVTEKSKSHTLTIPLEEAGIVTSAYDGLVLYITAVSDCIYILFDLVAFGCK